MAARDQKGRISTEGGASLGQNPFGSLTSGGLPSAPTPQEESGGRKGAAASGAAPSTSRRDQPNRNRGRIEIRRTTAGRGGKTVTLVSGFVGIGLPEKEQLTKKMRAACGCGGTVKDGDIEIQGDNRERVAAILAEAGFRPVMAGG